MSKSTDEYIKHILQESEYLTSQSEKMDISQFTSDQTSMRAFARSLEVIGEAAKQVPEEYRQTHPEVDWKGMAGLRDRLIHHYFGVDYEIVWDVVKNEVPKLKEQLGKLLTT